MERLPDLHSAHEWEAIWERKGREALARGSLALADLVRADGFDTPTGAMELDAWRARGRRIQHALGLDPQATTQATRVLEVGCGAGAMLFTLEDAARELYGVDVSPSLLALAARALPRARLELASAVALPFRDDSFDAVFSHSVFAYFSSENYAERALAEIGRVARAPAPILVLDVPDAATRHACEAARATLLGEAGAQAIGRPPHLYLSRELFVESARRLCRPIRFLDAPAHGHAMGAFRYDVWLGATA